MDISASGYKDFLWAVEVQRFIMELIGLWPKTDKFTKSNLLRKLHAGIVLILFIFVSNIPAIYACIQVWGNMVRLISNLQTTIPLLMITAKYVIMLYKQTVFLSIVNMMEEDWIAFKLDAERAVMIRRAHTARFIMKFGHAFMAVSILIDIIPIYFGIQISNLTNFTNRKPLPLMTYHFYDTNKSLQFELALFFQILTLLLENFRYQLIRLVSCKDFNITLNDIIARHLRLIRFANNIENTYSLMLLMMVLHFGIIFCLSGFLCVIMLTDREIDGTKAAVCYSILVILVFLVNTFLYCGAGDLMMEQIFKKGEMNKDIVMEICFVIYILISLLMNTFVYCGAGEMVVEQSNAVYRAICDLEWYKLESQKARNLILLMIRTNHPFHITAGKIIPLTIATFCSILKTSCGYISFLLAKR
ncbi:PREDICTED: uncharacterized protein LOC105558588 isoform X4 [Vollenhovia emeryi]|uniref:uncharacterized protein LOC105558588 isoform X4 n=1 Tax=Vollenhovia emeryi TaxID=411798 RepID=UPI0005F3DA69|nr:PREDICTED: uncharacterized protein LOC105558588 isoform X4 [Vollenhovia emeryi]